MAAYYIKRPCFVIIHTMENELFTAKKHMDFEVIMDLAVINARNDLPHIGNDERCKLIVLSKGIVSLTVNGKRKDLKAPSALYLSDRDKVTFSKDRKFQAVMIFFKPSVVNDAFTYERLYAGEFEDTEGTTLFQDYLLIRNFVFDDPFSPKAASFTPETLADMLDITDKLDRELKFSMDGYWSCRSRSYFIELLYKLKYCYANNSTTGESNASFISRVHEFIFSHISEKITLERLTSEFNVNRNALNRIFRAETGLTCIDYINYQRMSLARLWLTDTGIPVSEIARRLGFEDPNYFSKAFRKATGRSPTQYRTDSPDE